MNSDVSGRSRTARQSGATKTLEQLIKKRGVIVGQMAGRGAVSLYSHRGMCPGPPVQVN